jgi:hypothetical protein
MTEQIVTLTIDSFTQSQSHGLFWDSEIRQKVFGLPECKNDTQKYDVSCSKNKFNPQENISIKTSGNSNIDCGDIMRFYDRDDETDITIILVRYEQINNKKKIKEIIEINYSDEMRNILFGSVTTDILNEYVQLIKNIPNGTVTEAIKKNYKEQKNKIQETYNMKINISPKVDSKKQRRVQCSITKIDKLLEEYPQFIISRTTEPIIRGIHLTSIIDSDKRVRNKKE